MTITLYRAVGFIELKLIENTDWKEFPPRLPHQPIFYPVINKSYATQMARGWNMPQGGGFVLSFEIRSDYIDKFDIKIVGSSEHKEYWIPAEQLSEFNKNIIGKIRLEESYTINK